MRLEKKYWGGLLNESSSFFRESAARVRWMIPLALAALLLCGGTVVLGVFRRGWPRRRFRPQRMGGHGHVSGDELCRIVQSVFFWFSKSRLPRPWAVGSRALKSPAGRTRGKEEGRRGQTCSNTMPKWPNWTRRPNRSAGRVCETGRGCQSQDPEGSRGGRREA